MKGDESLPVRATIIHRGSPFSNAPSPSTSLTPNVEEARRHIEQQLRKNLSTENVEVEPTMASAADVPQPASSVEPTSSTSKVKLEPSSSWNFGGKHKRDVSSHGSATKIIDISDSPQAPRPSVVKEEIPPCLGILVRWQFDH